MLNQRLRGMPLQYFLTLPYTRTFRRDFWTSGKGEVAFYINLYDLWLSYTQLPVIASEDSLPKGLRRQHTLDPEIKEKAKIIFKLPQLTGSLALDQFRKEKSANSYYEIPQIFKDENYNAFIAVVQDMYFAVLKSYLVLLYLNDSTYIEVHITIPDAMVQLIQGLFIDSFVRPQSTHISLGDTELMLNRINLINKFTWDNLGASLSKESATELFFQEIMFLYRDDLRVLENLNICELMYHLTTGGALRYSYENASPFDASVSQHHQNLMNSEALVQRNLGFLKTHLAAYKFISNNIFIMEHVDRGSVV